MSSPVPAGRVPYYADGPGARAYESGRWCGQCRYGVVEDPPCCYTAPPATPAEDGEQCETCAAAPAEFAAGLDLWHASGHAHMDRTGVHPPPASPTGEGERGAEDETLRRALEAAKVQRQLREWSTLCGEGSIGHARRGALLMAARYLNWLAVPPAAAVPVPSLPEPTDPTPKRRLRECVEAWPDCWSGGYDPHCCRFPKSCSCTTYHDAVTDDDLEHR